MTQRPPRQIVDRLDNRLSDAELRTLLADAEAQLAALEPADPLQPLEALSDRELEALAAARTSEEAKAIIETRLAGQPKRKTVRIR